MARFSSPRPVALWCPNRRQAAANAWSFPRPVDRLLRQLTAGRTVLHLFGGLAGWGIRLDIDRDTRPQVIGDAWLPPFLRDSFDDVILDPPYIGINQQMKSALIRGAAYVARDRVFWFHTQWIASDAGLRRERSWLVRVGDSCACRCLIEWRVTRQDKAIPILEFTRGPALKYRRWLHNPPVRLPFGELEPDALED